MARLVTLEVEDLPVIDTANESARKVYLGPTDKDAAKVVFDALMGAMDYLQSKTGLRTGQPIGFSMADEGFGRSIIYQYRRKEWLSERQFAAVQKLVVKYRRQLSVDAGMDPTMLSKLVYPGEKPDAEPETSAHKAQVLLLGASDAAVRVRFLDATKYGNEMVWLPKKNVVKDTLQPLLDHGRSQPMSIYIVGWFAKKLGLVK